MTWYQDSTVRESMSTEWTDEKHCLYLKSMEASFINDLYNSVDTLGWRLQRQLGEKRSNTCLSSGQVWCLATLFYLLIFVLESKKFR